MKPRILRKINVRGVEVEYLDSDYCFYISFDWNGAPVWKDLSRRDLRRLQVAIGKLLDRTGRKP